MVHRIGYIREYQPKQKSNIISAFNHVIGSAIYRLGVKSLLYI